MRYFIGVPIPKQYKNKIEMLRAEFRYFTTEPHVTLVPPPALPDDDSFIKQIIVICKSTHKFSVKLNELGQFGNRVLFINVDSPELINLYETIYQQLDLVKEKRNFVPHLTVAKQRVGRPIDIELIKKRAEQKLPAYPEFVLNSIVIYKQPKEKSVYLPFMEVPFSEQ